MTTTGIRTFDQSVETTREWLKDVQEEMSLGDEQQAFVVTRAVLHTLRDRLTVKGAAEFAAQLPMLLQGLFFHEWNPTDMPHKIRSREEFLNLVSERLMGRYDAEEATRAVFAICEDRMTEGQIETVKGILPEQIRELWPV